MLANNIGLTNQKASSDSVLTLVAEVMRLGVELSHRGAFHAHVWYSGHVNRLSLNIVSASDDYNAPGYVMPPAVHARLNTPGAELVLQGQIDVLRDYLARTGPTDQAPMLAN